MPLNIPILLTWLRIILIPLLIAVYLPSGSMGSGHRARPRGDADFRRRCHHRLAGRLSRAALAADVGFRGLS
jgi:phosphatidylglycerophosphate synthase